MANTYFNQWSQYLSQNDYNILVDFVDATKNGQQRDKCLLFHGTGGNGKSTLLKQIHDYLGDVNCDHMRAHMNRQEDFTKKLFYAEDEEDGPNRNLESFIKTVLGREPVVVRGAGMEVGLTYPYIANLILVSNGLKWLDNKPGLAERMRIIEFTHSFYNNQ